MSITPSLSSSILNSAKRYQSFANYIQWFILLVAIVSTFFSETLSYIFAVAILLSEIFVLLIKHLATKKKSLGQQCSRVNILSNGLGVSNAIAESYLEAEVSESEFNSKSVYSPEAYYSSSSPVGDTRLKEILCECCFWTKNLYEKASTSLYIFLAIYLVLYLLILLLSVEFGSITESLPFDKIIILIISAAPLKDVVTDIIRFKGASSDLRRLDESLSRPDCNSNAVYLAFSDYAVITNSAPLIPDNIYLANQERLNKLWEQRSA